MDKYTYSIVVPVHNSGHILANTVSQIVETLNNSDQKIQVILIDDASVDHSWQVILALKNEYPDLILAKQLKQNVGQHMATVYGFELCKGEFVFTIDDDQQIPPEEMTKLIKKQDEAGADLVYGTCSVEKKNPVIGACRSVVVSIIKTLYGLEHFGSSLRLIKTELVQEVLNLNDTRILFDSILVFKARKISYSKVNRKEEQISKSGYSIFNLMKFTMALISSYMLLSTIPKKSFRVYTPKIASK